MILPCVWALTAGNGTIFFSLYEYRNNPAPYELKDPMHFLQLPCFLYLDPVPSFLSYAYKVGRSYPAGIVLGHTLNLYKRFILCSNTERTAIVVNFENN